MMMMTIYDQVYWCPSTDGTTTEWDPKSDRFLVSINFHDYQCYILLTLPLGQWVGQYIYIYLNGPSPTPVLSTFTGQSKCLLNT